MSVTDPDMDINVLLDHYRPDRYDPNDHSWMDPVIDIVADHMSEYEARQIASSHKVSNKEAVATRQTNRLLRAIASSGELPMEWLGSMAWPLAVDDDLRVSLRAATADDFRLFAQRERRAASLDFTARNASCEGALVIAEAMDTSGATVAADLAGDAS